MSNAILLEHIYKTINNRRILNDISLEVERGSIFGFLGPNGAGKTTSIRILLGLFNADSGTAEILGKPAALDAMRRDLGFVLEADGLYENLTARANIAFYCRLYGLTRSIPPERIDRVLEMVGLADRADDKVAAYSKGMRQKLAIARAMVHDPELFILDEPTAGVDPTGQVEVREIVLDLARRGKTIFLSSHNLDEIQRICDHVALINRGEIRLRGPLEELRHNRERQEITIEVRGGTERPGMEGAIAGLIALPFVDDCTPDDGRLVLGVNRPPDLRQLLEVLGGYDIEADEIRREQASLEQIYTAAMQEAQQ